MAQKMTPIERAIKGKTDRRLRYLDKQKRAGLQRVTVFVPVHRSEEIKYVAQLMRDHPDAIAFALRK